MPCVPRIDELRRDLPTGEVDVVFIVCRQGETVRSAWIGDEQFSRRPGENLEALVDRALRDYRAMHPPRQAVSALIVDCST